MLTLALNLRGNTVPQVAVKKYINASYCRISHVIYTKALRHIGRRLKPWDHWNHWDHWDWEHERCSER